MINIKKISAAFCYCSLFMFCLSSANAAELNTKYAVINYKDDSQLRNFNQELYIGKLSYYIQGTAQTFQDEVKQKIDVIISRVQAVLDMKPTNLRFNIVILDTEKEVTETYKKLYSVETDFLAFYSVGKNSVFVSLENVNLKILSHEFGHAVIENYFDVSPPRKIHEVLAQFAEQHILD